MILPFRHPGPVPPPARLEPDPGVAGRFVREAAMHADRGEDRQALHCYQQALLIDETHAPTWLAYGKLQARLGLREDAVESFEFALREEPELHAARYGLAKLLFEMGRPLVALTHFREIPDADLKALLAANRQAREGPRLKN